MLGCDERDELGASRDTFGKVSDAHRHGGSLVRFWRGRIWYDDQGEWAQFPDDKDQAADGAEQLEFCTLSCMRGVMRSYVTRESGKVRRNGYTDGTLREASDPQGKMHRIVVV